MASAFVVSNNSCLWCRQDQHEANLPCKWFEKIKNNTEDSATSPTLLSSPTLSFFLGISGRDSSEGWRVVTSLPLWPSTCMWNIVCLLSLNYNCHVMSSYASYLAFAICFLNNLIWFFPLFIWSCYLFYLLGVISSSSLFFSISICGYIVTYPSLSLIFFYL
jgi:hypothetical protein